MRIPRLHKEVSLFSPQTIAATFSRLADSITSIVAGNATYTDPDGVVRESQIGTMVRQTVDNVIIKATATATTAAQGGQSLIQSLINVAPEGVRISAEKVDIDGAAIFTTGKLSKVVTSSQTEWYSSTSATAKSDGSWSTTQPSVVAGRYVWERQKLTYSDGKSEYKPSAEGVCTQGQTDLSSYSTTSQMEGAIDTAKSDAISAANSATDTKLQSVNTAITNVKATADAAAPKANAVKRTQRIYYRSDSATKPATPSAWVTKEDDGTGTWTKMHVAITSTHKYIYTCEQSEKADGTLGCTAVLRDNTITVIDGGNVITHSIVADKLDADSVKANIVQTTDLNASKITSGDIATERMSANVVKAVKATVSDLYALVAKIGGFVINATSIFSGTAVTSNADNAVALSTADFTRTVNGTSRAGLRFAIGDKFGVEGDGTLYANGANITSINADNISSGSVSADRIKANVISAVNDGTGTINADKVNVSQITIGESQVTNLTTDLDNKANSSDLTAETSKRKATYGTCSTAAGTTAKVVTCANFELYAGAAVTVTFTTANTAVVPKLNVNSTGAVAVWYNNAAASNDNPVLWGANATLTFVYDGSHWVLDEKPPTYAVACSTAAATKDKAATVTGALVVNGTTVAVSFSTANTYVAASLGFNLSGTGDDVIRVDGAVTSASNTFTWAANTTLTLVRRGLCWDVTGNDQASKTATTYLTEGTSNGLMVHRKSDATTGVKITDDVDILRDGASVCFFGTDEDDNAFARIGYSDSSHLEESPDGVDVYVEEQSLGAPVKKISLSGNPNRGTTAASIQMFPAVGTFAIDVYGGNTFSERTWGPMVEICADTPDKSYYNQFGIGIRYVSEDGSEYYFTGITMQFQETGTLNFNADAVRFNDDVIQGSAIASLPASKLTGTIADTNLPTKGSAGTAGTPNATSGATLAVPYVTTDAYGRVTAKGTHTHTINNLPSTALPTVPVDKGGTGQTGVEKSNDIAAAMSAASGVTITAAQVATWGKVMQVLITANATAAKSGTWTVGTMTAGHRPELVTFGTSNLAAIEQCRMGTDGAVSVAGTLAANASVSLTFTYLLS